MSNIAQQISHSYRSILVSWYRLQERAADFFSLPRRISLLILLLSITPALALSRLIAIGELSFDKWLWISLTLILFVVLPFLAVRPEWIVIAATFVVASVVSPIFWDVLALAERGVTLPNLLIAYGLLILFIRFVAAPVANAEVWKSPTTVAVVIFLFLTVIVGLVYHVLVMGLPYRKEIAELQHMILWLIYFLVLGFSVNEHRFRVIQAGILFVAALGALPTILQALFGTQSIFFLKLAPRDIRIEELGGLTRVIPLGESLITIAFLVSWQMMVASSGAKRVGWGALGALLGTALLMTLTRHVWFGVLFGLGMFWFFSETRTKVNSAIAVVLLATVLGSVVIISSPVGTFRRDDFFARIYNRFLSTFAEDPMQYSLTRASSVGQRVYELRAVAATFPNAPWFGYGWSTSMPLKITWEPYRGHTIRQTTYIHNSLVWIVAKSGIIGLVGLLVLWITGVLRGYALYHRARDPMARAWLLALWVGFIATIIAAQFEPVFWIRNRLVGPALALAMMECVYYFAERRRQHDPMEAGTSSPVTQSRFAARW